MRLAASHAEVIPLMSDWTVQTGRKFIDFCDPPLGSCEISFFNLILRCYISYCVNFIFLFENTINQSEELGDPPTAVIGPEQIWGLAVLLRCHY